MAESKKSSEKVSSGIFKGVAKAFDLLGTFKLFLAEIKETVGARWDLFLHRLAYILVVYIWLSLGILFAILGVFFLLIDFGGVSRGIVFCVGGLVIFLVGLVLLQAAKIKKRS